ncbi:hypothetical protein ACFOWZ_05435 [Lentzea rhizosphaerae]|uniref:Uncharacterized protein n=1 Tax=Lentzea rhizosphaerae TaxID=2041025 RepID=A0ABV8BP97_9PSEU
MITRHAETQSDQEADEFVQLRRQRRDPVLVLSFAVFSTTLGTGAGAV